MASSPDRGIRLSAVWIIPALCLGMVLYFAALNLRDRGPEIEILIPEAENLNPGKTKIKYRGVTVGKVTKLAINTDEKEGGVIVTGRLERRAAPLAREGTKFIIIKPEVSFQGVSGLTTIFSGAALELRPGEGAPARRFKGYSDQAALNQEKPGLVIKLTSPRIGSLEKGDGVYYRGLPVGHVIESGLSPTAQNIVVKVKIDQENARLVRANTEFWEASGVKAKFGLFGAKVSMDSVQTLLRGGVAFATPDNPAAPAADGASYILHPEPKPDWEKWSPKL